MRLFLIVGEPNVKLLKAQGSQQISSMHLVLKVFFIIYIKHIINIHTLFCSMMTGNPYCEKWALGQFRGCLLGPSHYFFMSCCPIISSFTSWHLRDMVPNMWSNMGKVGERLPGISYDNTVSYFESTSVNKAKLMCMNFMPRHIFPHFISL